MKLEITNFPSERSILTTICEKNKQLELIEKTARRRFGINKTVLITALVLGTIGFMSSALTILRVPAALLLIGGFAYTLMAGKTKEQRTAITQIKLLRKVVRESMLAKGIGPARVDDYMKDYDTLTRSLDFDADTQQRFNALCEAAGVGSGAIFIDQRLL